MWTLVFWKNLPPRYTTRKEHIAKTKINNVDFGFLEKGAA